MIRAPSPPDETERLAALRSYEVMDTLPEQAFDDLAALAAHICGAPMAQISLVDEHRQWFKARVGLTMTETARDISFCGHTILGRDLFVVPDASRDERFVDNPLVTGEPGIRFYAGAPLLTPEGTALGAMCVIDRQPRQLTPAQEQALEILGRQVIFLLELRRRTRALVASEERGRAVVESALDAIVTIDHHGLIQAFNPAAEAMFGRSSPEVLGQEMAELLIPPEARAAHRDGLARYLASGEHKILGQRLELTALRANGDCFPVELTVNRLAGSTPPSFTAFLRDLTDRRKAELTACRLAAIVESSDDAIFGEDLAGKITSWNAGAEALFGYTAEEMLGHSCRRLIPSDRQTEARQIQGRIMAGHHVQHFESARLHRNGRRLTVSITASPIRDARGAVNGFSRVVRDITGQKEARQQLLEREEQLRLFAIHSPAAIAMLDREINYLVASSRWLRDYGLAEQSVVGRSHYEVFPEVPQRWREVHQRCLAGATEVCEEDSFERADGTTAWVRWEVHPWRKADGSIGGIIIFSEDITARKLAAEALEASEARFRALVQWSPESIVVHRAGRVLFANQATVRMCGASSAEALIGRAILDYIHPDYHEITRSRMRSAAERGGDIPRIEEIFVKEDGTLVDAEVQGTTIIYDGQPAVYSSIRDVTERRQAERDRHASEARYRSLFENAPDGILIANPERRYLDANASICRMLGYTREEILQLGSADLVDPSEVRHIGAIREIMRDQTTYHREWQFRRKDGSSFPAEVIGTRMPDGNLLALIRDTTERKRSEARFRRLVDSNAQGVMFWKREGGISGANDAFLQLTGHGRPELESGSLDWNAMTPPEFAEADRRAQEQIAANGVCVPYEKECIRKDGTRVPILIGSAAFEDNPDEGVCFVLDLTERKQLEQQFLRAQRLESIGTLAGGIAHDLNNSLGPIIMALDLLRTRFTDPSSQNLLALMGASAQRGADMVKQVLSFARGYEGRRVAVRLGTLIGDIRKIASDTFLKHIQVRTLVPADLRPVTGDPTQLHQVLLNLCVNARDALPDGGVITISAENVEVDPHFAGLTAEVQSGPYILVTVEDNGTGMRREVLENIFDPFFTTKEVGRGTGLGLSTSLAIVKSHGGFLKVASEFGKGSKFAVYLPARTEDGPASLVEERVEIPRGQGELILVVDDEPSVRHVTKQTLESFGYRVLLASDGAEAVATFTGQQEEISAVVTDMTMPVMDGLATIRVLQRLNPAVRIVAVSGLAADGHLAQVHRLGVKHILPKPHTAEALLTVLRQLLGDRGTGPGGAAPSSEANPRDSRHRVWLFPTP